MTLSPRRGDIYYADLGPPLGNEPCGRQPCLIIQSDANNATSPVVIVAVVDLQPGGDAQRTEAELSGTGAGPARALLHMVRTVDKSRLERFVGHITDEDEDQDRVDEAIAVSLGLVDL